MLYRGTEKRTATRHEALGFWRLLLFSNSQSRVFLPCYSIKWYENATINFSEWWRKVDTSDLRKNAKLLSRSTEADPHKSKKEPHQNALEPITPTGPSGLNLNGASQKEEKIVVQVPHSDGESEVDPKHERKRKISVLQTDDLMPDDRIFEGVLSASHMPSQELEGDVALEVKAAIQKSEQFVAHENRHVWKPSRIASGRGKELAMLNKMKPMVTTSHSISESSTNGGAFADTSEVSIASPHLGNLVADHSNGSHKNKMLRTLSSHGKPGSPPTCSVISFRPSNTIFGNLFECTIREVHSIYLTKLKNASYADVRAVAAQANESYRSILQLKGDPTPLREKVDAYVGAVNAYLMVEKVAAERQRPEALEYDLTLQHQALDRARALLYEAQNCRFHEATEHSHILGKINNLETELINARDTESKLSDILKTRDESIAILETKVKDEEKSLAKLESVPVMSAEDEILRKEQRVHLEEMRNSLNE